MSKNHRLKTARVQAGFRTAADAARHLGVPYGTYSGHESGSRGIKEEDLKKYAKAFDVSVVWLAYEEVRSSNLGSGSRISLATGSVGKIDNGSVSWRKDVIDRSGSFNLTDAFSTKTGKPVGSIDIPDPSYFAPSLELGEKKLGCLVVRGDSISEIAVNGSAIYFGMERQNFSQDIMGIPCLCFAGDDICFVGVPNILDSATHIKISKVKSPHILPVSALSFCPILAVVTAHGRSRALHEFAQVLLQAGHPSKRE